MKKHPVELLAETKGMDGYHFIDWLKERTDSEFEDLINLSLSLSSSIEKEKERREGMSNSHKYSCDNCENKYKSDDLEQIAGTNFIMCVDCFKKYISEVEE